MYFAHVPIMEVTYSKPIKQQAGYIFLTDMTTSKWQQHEFNELLRYIAKGEPGAFRGAFFCHASGEPYNVVPMD